MIKGLRRDIKSDEMSEDIKNLFQKNGEQYTVKKIVLAYDLKKITQIKQEVERVLEEKKTYYKEGDINNQNFSDEQIDRLESNIFDIQKNIVSKNEDFLGIAFVSFSTKKGTNYTLYYLKLYLQ